MNNGQDRPSCSGEAEKDTGAGQGPAAKTGLQRLVVCLASAGSG